jgi:hypothetical protein
MHSLIRNCLFSALPLCWRATFDLNVSACNVPLKPSCSNLLPAPCSSGKVQGLVAETLNSLLTIRERTDTNMSTIPHSFHDQARRGCEKMKKRLHELLPVMKKHFINTHFTTQ